MVNRRAVSSQIAVILMVAVVVTLATITSSIVFGFTLDLTEPAPNVAEATGKFEPGADDQAVQVTHIAGDSVRVAEIEIIVRASGPGVDSETRLVNLPSDDSDLDSNNIEGDSDIVSEGFGAKGPSDPNQVIVEDFPADDNVWSAGETIRFEINVIGADFRDPPKRTGPDADELEVVIVHTPSEQIIFDETFRP